MKYQKNEIACTNDAIREALDSALALLDENTRSKIFEYLRVRHGIDLDSRKPVTKEAVELALGLMFGYGSIMIISRMNKRMAEIASSL